MKYLLIFFLSCSVLSTKKNNSLWDRSPRSSQTQPVASLEEAEQILMRKEQYFRSLFEQSFDPYYGTPKWSDHCLEINKIGELKKTKNIIYLPMRLLLNAKDEAGFCLSSYVRPPPILSHMIYYHCIGSKVMTRAVYDVSESGENVQWESLCGN